MEEKLHSCALTPTLSRRANVCTHLTSYCFCSPLPRRERGRGRGSWDSEWYENLHVINLIPPLTKSLPPRGGGTFVHTLARRTRELNVALFP
jgi:hypothetical protein